MESKTKNKTKNKTATTSANNNANNNAESIESANEVTENKSSAVLIFDVACF